MLEISRRGMEMFPQGNDSGLWRWIVLRDVLDNINNKIKGREKQMNLKSKFKRLLDIMLVHDDDCSWEENCQDIFCTNDNATPEECGCCELCQYGSPKIYEFTVDHFVEDTRYYYAFDGSGDNKKVFNISTEEEMYNVLEFFSTEVINKGNREDLQYFEKVNNLTGYANEFFKELIDKCFPTLDYKILPIRFHKFAVDMEEYGKEKQTGGRYSHTSKQNVIDIYHSYSTEIEKLKSNIRHEILHYALDASNMEYKDNSGIFHALCKIYDAGAYLEMDEYEQKIYNLFFTYQEIGKSELKYTVIITGSLDEEKIKDRNKLIDELDECDKILKAVEVEKERRRLKEAV